MSEHEQDHPAPEDPQSGAPEDHGAPAEAPQWIPVPPANPHAVGAGSRPGRALAIAAMAAGLVALLTAAVSAFYFSPLLAASAVLAFVAIVLGIIALVKRQRPLPASVTGLVAAGLAIIVAIAGGMFALGTALAPDIPDPGPDAGETAPPPSDAAIEWPANMATGGIIFGEGGAPVRSAPLRPGTAPQPAEVRRDGTRTDVLIYLDYRCPYCLNFEQANQELLDQALADGSTTVEIVPLTFLDRASAGSYYSSRVSGAMACVVDAQPEAAWKAHSALLSPEAQPEEGIAGPTNDELIERVDGAVGGLDRAARDCIAKERFVPFAKALNDWVFANPVPNAIDRQLRVTGTPLVLVNGVPYPGDPGDGAAFRAFFEKQSQ